MRALALVIFFGASVAQASPLYDELEPLKLEFFPKSKEVFFIETSYVASASLRKNGVHEVGFYGGGVAFSGVLYRQKNFGIRPALDLSLVYSKEKGRETFSASGLGLIYFDFGKGAFSAFIGIGGGWTHLQEKFEAMKKRAGRPVLASEVGFALAVHKNIAFLLSYRYLHGFKNKAIATRPVEADHPENTGEIDFSTHQARAGIRLKF